MANRNKAQFRINRVYHVIPDDSKVITYYVKSENGWISSQMRKVCLICEMGKYNNLNKNFVKDAHRVSIMKRGRMSVNDCIDVKWKMECGQTHKDECKGCLPGFMVTSWVYRVVHVKNISGKI